MTITDEMVSTAFLAMHEGKYEDARAALEAAAPLIRAADAERIKELEEAMRNARAAYVENDDATAVEKMADIISAALASEAHIPPGGA